MTRGRKTIRSQVIVPKTNQQDKQETDDLIAKRVIRKLGEKRTRSAGDEEYNTMPEFLQSPKKKSEKKETLNSSGKKSDLREKLNRSRMEERKSEQNIKPDAKQQRSSRKSTPKQSSKPLQEVSKRLDFSEMSQSDEDDDQNKFRQKGNKFYTERELEFLQRREQQNSDDDLDVELTEGNGLIPLILPNF